MGMTNEQIVQLHKEHPKAKSLRCTNLQPNYPNDEILSCSKNLDPTCCGRNFNPNGGSKVTV